LNETSLPDGGGYLTTLKAIVSVNKLTSFCESKGVSVEFKGGLFAMNMALQELNEKSELKAWENTYDIIIKVLRNSLDYKIETKTPTIAQIDGYWSVPISIYVDTNKNFKFAVDILLDFCKNANLNESEIKNITEVGKKVYSLNIAKKSGEYNLISLRNNAVLNDIYNIPFLLMYIGIYDIEVDNSINKTHLTEMNKLIPNFERSQFKSWGFYSGIQLFTQIFNGNTVRDYLYPARVTDMYKNQYYLLDDRNNLIIPFRYEYFNLKTEDVKFFSRRHHSDRFNIIDNNFFENRGPAFSSNITNEYKFINFYNIGRVLTMNINQVLTLEDIKKISEYKIVKINNSDEKKQ
jgi:hypothetical protein